MQQATIGQTRVQVPPYVPYKTFRTWLDSHKQGLPNRIDKSLMTTMSGAIQSGMMSGLRYLGLISENGTTTDRLRQLAGSEGDERKQTLRNVLEESYVFLFNEEFDVAHATGQSFSERFRQVANGDTARKCEAFFLAAAQDADLPVSKFITTRGSRKVSAGRQRQRRVSNGNGVAVQPGVVKPAQPPMNPPADETPLPPPSGSTKTVTFARGGELTLSISVDLFALNRAERDFALDLIDKMNEFELQSETTANTPRPSSTDNAPDDARF